MYFGAHGQANGMDNVLRAMKLVSERVSPGSIKLRMIGDGPLKQALIKLAERLELNEASFEPPVAQKAIPALASEADAFVIAVLDLPQLYRYGISMNKLFDYLSAARPVIIASNAVNNPVEESGGGITVQPENPEFLAQAILTVFRMSAEERYRIGCAGRRYVEENHGYNYLAGRLAATLDACIAENQ
jgi:glycosyltransferase involved in cell wall biosynthesis